MAKKAAAPATITLKHLAAALAEEHDLSKKAAEAILTDMVDKIAKHLKTGEPLPIKASKKVAFRAAKELKEAV
jgi:DNA-binding protein HU-beta